MELFHGPTWSFKDLALSCVGQFIPYFLSKRKKHFNIIVGRERTKSLLSFSSVLPFIFKTCHIRLNHRNNKPQRFNLNVYFFYWFCQIYLFRNVRWYRKFGHWSRKGTEVDWHCGAPPKGALFTDTGTSDDHCDRGQCTRV